MKKFFKSFALIAAAAMALAACQKEVEAPVQEEGLYEYRFAIDEGTKAVIGDSNIEWVAGDQVGMFIAPNGDFTGYKGYAKIDITTSPKTVILYSNKAIPAGTMAYAYAPYDVDNKEKEATSAKINLSSIQTGAQVSVMPLAGLPFTVEETIAANADAGNGSIKFMNLGSVINFKIFSTNEEYQSETVASVKFEANKTIAGSAYIDLTAVSVDDEGSLELTFMDEADEENSVRVDQEVAVAAEKEEATPIKMVILPGLFEGTVTVTTDVATYTKEIPSREFNRSGSRTFGLDLAKAERTEGVEEIVKTLPYEEAFTSNQGEFTIDNVSLPEAVATIWSFDSEHGAKATAYINKTNYASESWLVSPQIDLTGVSVAEITFDQCVNKYMAEGDGTLWIKKVGDEGYTQIANTYPTINTGATWSSFEEKTIDLSEYVGNKIVFAFKYISTASAAGTWEIKNFSAHIVKADPELAFGDGSLVIVATVNDEGIEEPELTNPHNLTVTYASTNTSVATVDENSGAVTIVAPGTTTIKASFAGNDDYAAATASYILTIEAATDCVSLPWAYPEEGASATRDGINAIGGVTTYGLGTDYAAANAPYQIKLDGTGDYFQIKTDSAIGAVSVKYKMLGGSNTSSLVISESVDGEEWATVETLSIAGSQNSTGEPTTTKEFAASSRYVKIVFNKGSNVGIGGLSITKADSRLNADISWSASVGSATITDGVVIASSYPSLTNSSNLTVSYESSNTTVATVDESTGVVTPLAAGNTNISAVFAGNDTYKPKTVSYVLTVTVNNTDGPVYTLQPAAGSNNGYANNCDVTIDGITWNVTGNAQQVPWRVGGKSLTNVDRAIYSKTALDYNIEKIEITHGAASGITVNSMTVIVAKDAEFNTVVSTLTPTFEANATVTVERPSAADWSKCFYKIVYNVTVSGTSNKFFEFTKADFYGE